MQNRRLWAAARRQPAYRDRAVYIEAEQTKIPILARVVLGQLLPNDHKLEWASTLTDVELLLVGASTPTPTAPGAANTANQTLERARTLFGQMQREYARQLRALRRASSTAQQASLAAIELQVAS